MNVNEYRNTLKVLKDAYKKANNYVDKIEARQFYLIFLKKFIKSEPKTLEEVRTILKEDGFDNEDILVLLNSIKDMVIVEKKENYSFILDENILEQNEKLISKLLEDLNNPNDLSIRTWFSTYYTFIEINKDKINLEKMCMFISDLFKRYDNNSKYADMLSRFIGYIYKLDRNILNLDIVNIKKNYNDSLKRTAYKESIGTLLKKYRYSFDDKGQLINESGKIISGESLKETMNNRFKIELIKNKTTEDLNNELIDPNYKKNRAMQMFIDTDVVDKIKNDFVIINANEKEYEDDSLVKKGLGNVK